jgi:hypothetical protein
MSMLSTELPQGKKYKGSISWFKLKFSDGRCKVEKRRPFGNDSYEIEPDEYEWIKTARQAESMWTFYHYRGTASYFSGEIRHPMGKKFADQP